MKAILAPVVGTMLLAAAPAAAQPRQTDAAATSPAATAPAAAPAPVDPAALAVAREILTVGIPPEKRSEMASSLIDTLADEASKNAKNLGITSDKDFQAVMDRSTQRMWDEIKPIMNAAVPDIYDSMAHAYARLFSIDDLKALLAFVKTPAGQRFFERAPQILKDPDVQASQQRMMAQLAGKLPEMMRENMRDIHDYVAKKGKQQKKAASIPVS